MKLLLLSFYYPPDLSAGSFRCAALVKALRQISPELQIDVFTTQPNRYHQSRVNAPTFERDSNFTVRRFSLPEHDSGMLDQARAFAAYFRNSMRAIQSESSYDAVFATSSRLMTASMGALISRRAKAPLYLDIRDLFADTISDVLPGWQSKVLGPAVKMLERWTFRSATRINIVSEGFSSHIRKITPKVDLRIYTNGIDDEFLVAPPPAKQLISDRQHLIVYAGNVGQGQGLHRIIPNAARELGSRARFRVIGHGGQIGQLRIALGQHTENVELIPPIPRSQLFHHYAEADILFLHLNDYPAFRKVLPSKIFEYAATGRPIVAGVAGYSADFIREHIPGACVFAPCDTDGMVKAIETLGRAARTSDRTRFLERYSRRNITTAMATDVVQFIRASHKRTRSS